MSLDAVLAAGKAAFAGICTDTCRITRPAVAGDPTYIDTTVIDEDTGQYPDPGEVTVYEGPCRVQVKADINSNVVETTAGEREWTYLTATLELPVDHPATAVGDVTAVDIDNVAEILTAPHAPSLVGVKLNIQGTYHKSHAVYSRYRVREVVA